MIGGWLFQNKVLECSVEQEGIQSDEKRESIWKRQIVNQLYFRKEITKEEIAELMEVSINFVVKWTQSENQDFDQDDRGWKKGKRRKWEEKTIEDIVEIREELEEDPEENYWGPTAVEVEYRKRFPEREVPPVRTIGQILTDLGMTSSQKHESKRGALRYLHYPERTLYQKIGGRLLEADFVGDKYITGRSEPIRFIGYSIKEEPRVRHYERVQGETTDQFIEHTKVFFNRFEKPSVVKTDNGTAMSGGGVHRRTISRSMQFLLEENVHPVFSVPRKPATQASIEGSNSLFSRKFWNRHEFDSLREIDERLERFNENTRKYLQYEPPEEEQEEKRKEFEPVVYFLRQVREKEGKENGVVRVMNEEVEVKRDYIKYFVLSEWRLSEEKLLIRFENREDDSEEEEERVTSEILKAVDFPIHEASKKRCEELLSG